MQLAYIGMADTLILMVLALVVFGPRRLPQIGRQIGKLMFEFRKASNDFKFQMEEELRAAEEADRRKREDEERQKVAALAAQSQASVSAPAQSVEASADIGAVEPSAASTYPEQYPAEVAPAEAAPAEAATPEAVPTIQPPQTGEQVSAERPSYYYETSEAATDLNAIAEVNPDADAAANAEGLTPGNDAALPKVECESPAPAIHNPETGPSTPPKETVSQHG